MTEQTILNVLSAMKKLEKYVFNRDEQLYSGCSEECQTNYALHPVLGAYDL